MNHILEIGNSFSFLDVRVDVVASPYFCELGEVVDLDIAGPIGTSQLTLGLDVAQSLLNGLADMAKDWQDMDSVDDIPRQDLRDHLPDRVDRFDSLYAIGAS